MATYSTDLTTLTTAESGTWTEFASPYNGGGSPALSGENFIQGTDCYAQNSGKANGLEISIVFDAGTNQTFATDDVLFAWVFYAVGTNLETYANSGWRFGIGSSVSAWDWFRIGGSDYGRNPYGGWFNVAIDPTATESGTIGGGNGGNYRYFGNVPYTINEITKGDPTAVDALRIGRGELSITGTGSSFAEIAEYNDYNAGGTPPGTSSTSLDSGRHRLGLFQENGGVYIWKGLLSFGLSATTITFSDSNVTIIVDDCPHTYAEFNKVEINNASSSVTWTNVTFIGTASTTVAVGRFEMIDNATVNLTGCAFNDLDTFIFQSNATMNGCTWNGCGQITVDGADFDGCAFNSCDPVFVDVVSEAANITNSSFSSSGTGHGLNIGDGTSILTTQSVTLTGLDFSGYDTADPGTAANKAIHVNSASGGGTITLNISGGSGVTAAHHVRATNCTVVVSADTTVTFTGLKDYTEVLVQKVSDGSQIAKSEDHLDTGGGAQGGTTDNRTFSFSAPSGTEVRYVLHNYDSAGPDYETIRVNSYTVPANDTSIAIAQRIDRNSV